jgi:hypothetical protein
LAALLADPGRMKLSLLPDLLPDLLPLGGVSGSSLLDDGRGAASSVCAAGAGC